MAQHFMPLLKYALTFGILLIWLPQILVAKNEESLLDRVISGFMGMVLLLIVIVYILVFLKLYEVISLSALLLILIYNRACQMADIHSFSELLSQIQILIYDGLDGLHQPQKITHKISAIPLKIYAYLRTHWMWIITFAIIFGYAGWLRYYDAFVHAAPPLSDSYVTLAWMKYINERILFHDGLYPHGFHIFLSVLAKFSANNQLFVLKYTGPLNGLLILLGIWFFVYKTTESKSSAYFAAVAYGCTGTFFDLEMFRQSATNSQEFAMVFLLPTLWYLIRYFEKENRNDLVVAASGLCVMGFVHTLIFAFAVWLCLGIILSRFLMRDQAILRKNFQVFIFGTGATLVSLVPLAVGYLLGKRPHGASLAFLNRLGNQIPFANLGLLEALFLAGIGTTILLMVVERDHLEKAKRLFTVLCLLASVLIFYGVLPALTQSVVLDLRKITLALPFLGVVMGVLHSLVVRPWKSGKSANIFGMFLTMGALIAVVIFIKPEPLVPMKMERDTMVQQYLNIKEQFLPTEWMIVSHEEEYALVLGKGLHMFIADFIKDIRPDRIDMEYVNDSSKRILTPDIFIYYEKEVYTTPYIEMVENYKERVREKPLLEKWLQTYQEETGNLKIYYEDKDFIVYWIHNEKSDEEKFEDIWER